METQAYICPDCSDDHEQGTPCPVEIFAAFWIGGDPHCWDCAELIGHTAIQQVTHPADFRCDGCGGKFLGQRP